MNSIFHRTSDRKVSPMQTTASHEGSLRIAMKESERWHYTRSIRGMEALEGSLSQRSKARPRLDGLWKRYLAGHLWVMEVLAEPPGGTLILTCDKSHQLVYIPIREGCPVCVKFTRVIAMTSNVRIRSRMRLSFPAIWMGHVSVCYAECTDSGREGGIVLEIAGETTTVSQDAQFSMNRLVAWDAKVRFCVAGLHGIADVFASEPLVRARCDSSLEQVVLLEPNTGGSRKTIVSQMMGIARMLLPI